MLFSLLLNHISIRKTFNSTLVLTGLVSVSVSSFDVYTSSVPGRASYDFVFNVVESVLPWVPEVYLALRMEIIAAEGRWYCTGGEAARKTSVSELVEL